MKRNPWAITGWGNDKDEKATIITIDNRDLTGAKHLNETTPLLRMDVSERFTREELMAYAVIIRDRLNAEEVVEALTRTGPAP